MKNDRVNPKVEDYLTDIVNSWAGQAVGQVGQTKQRFLDPWIKINKSVLQR